MSLAPIPLSQWSTQDRDMIAAGFPRARKFLTPDGPPLPTVLGLFAHHPELTSRWLAFSGALLDAGELEPADRELLILRVAHRTGSSYEWAEHVRFGRAAGLTDEQIAAAAQPAAEHVLLRAADEQVDDHRISAATWAELAAQYSPRQLLELLFVIGSYVCLAGVLNTAGIESEENSDGTLAEAR